MAMAAAAASPSKLFTARRGNGVEGGVAQGFAVEREAIALENDLPELCRGVPKPFRRGPAKALENIDGHVDDNAIGNRQARGATEIGGSDGTPANVDAWLVLDVGGGAMTGEIPALALGHNDLRRCRRRFALLCVLSSRGEPEHQTCAKKGRNQDLTWHRAAPRRRLVWGTVGHAPL